nr:MAG TPA: hypothetical protein [Bacteriophage sp.]
MELFTIYWESRKGEELTTIEEAEDLRKALRQVNYFEKKTGYKIVGIEMIKKNGKEEKENTLLDKE